MNLLDKNGKQIKPKEIGNDWEKAIDFCIDEFDKEEAKKRIKAYVKGLDEVYRKRLIQATKASILNDKSVIK